MTSVDQDAAPTDPHGHDAGSGKGKDKDKTVTLIINTRAREWDEKKISYEQLVDIVYPGQPVGDGESVTVKYSRGPASHHTGSLTAGHDVPVKDGMIFDVYRTNRS